MQVNLTGKTALVGGSSKGLGRAVAFALAQAGASVVVMARDIIALKELVEQLPSQGQQHQFLVVDFSSFASFKEKIDAFFQKNSVDILVNNTQGPPAGHAIDLQVEDYQVAFDLLFKCAVHTTQRALPQMQKKHWGRIINVSSVTVKEPLPQLALSNSVRAALASWAKSLSLDVGSQGITVNTVLTGYFNTARLRALNEAKAAATGQAFETVEQALIEKIPLRQLGDPTSYGALVTFLASAQASYITGTTIPIDGGVLQSY